MTHPNDPYLDATLVDYEDPWVVDGDGDGAGAVDGRMLSGGFIILLVMVCVWQWLSASTSGPEDIYDALFVGPTETKVIVARSRRWRHIVVGKA